MGKFCEHSVTFTGKVGQVVGQHWKDIHVLRTYGNYKYTRTPEQAKCRSIFKDAVILSHIAQAAMYPAPCFENGHRSGWNGRVSLSIAMFKAGYRGIECIPIVPLNTAPVAGTINLIKLTKTNENECKIEFSHTGDSTEPLFISGLWYSIVVLNKIYWTCPEMAVVIYGRADGTDTSNTLITQDCTEFFTGGIKYLICSSSQYNDEDPIFYTGILSLPNIPF